MRALLCLFAVALVAVQGALHTPASLPEDVRNGLFKGRSGDIVLKPNNYNMASDRLAVFLDNAKGAFFAQSTEPVDATSVMNAVAGALGLPAPHPENGAPSVVAADFFNHASANILMAIESLGAETIERYGMSKLAELQKRGAVHRLDFQSYPASSLALAASVATGQAPSQHGIVGRTWRANGRKVEAFSQDAHSLRANLADVLQQTFGGKALTVAASADSQLARAFCTNPRLSGANDLCVSLEQDLAMKAAGAKPLALTTEQVQRALKERSGVFGQLEGFSIVLSADGNTVVVQKGSTRAEYDLRRKEDSALFAELAFAVDLPAKLSESQWAPLIRDSVPDSYALIFSSLTGLVERYGRESVQFIMGARLLDAALPLAMDHLSALYPERAAAELLLLGSHDTAVDSLDKRQVREALRSLLPQAAADASLFPHVYANLPSEQLSRVCDTLSVELGKLGYSTFCPTGVPAASSFVSLDEKSDARLRTLALSGDDNPTQAEIERYQVAMWTAIGLALVLFAAIYSIAFMEIRKDSLLYGNPLSINKKSS